VEVQLHVFVSSVLDGGGRPASRPGPSTSRGSASIPTVKDSGWAPYPASTLPPQKFSSHDTQTIAISTAKPNLKNAYKSMLNVRV
jgi:hypothetical protein